MRDANAQLLNLPRDVMGDAAGPSMNRQSADASTTVDRLSPMAFGLRISRRSVRL
jgi:hypothetical protein